MEKITFHNSSKKDGTHNVRYRLRDGRMIQLCHSSDIRAEYSELEKFNPDGTTKPRVKVYNADLAAALKKEYAIMSSAYALMKDRGLDLTSKVFEHEINAIKNPLEQQRIDNPSVVESFRAYANQEARDGIIGEARHRHILVVCDKLERFLLINGESRITAQEFSEKHILEFRNFIMNEYSYVEEYENLYEKVKERNKPTAQLSINTVASQMKMLKSFFADLENADIIVKSPFRRLGKEKSKSVMHTMYDEPFFLRQEELLQVLSTDVNNHLQGTKDAFVVQCALGCRVNDYQRLGMHALSVNEEGIPFVHYIPGKTIKEQTTNIEIKTPIIRYAFDIIKRTGFNFPILKNLYGTDGYNARIKSLLRVCEINREVAVFNTTTGQNDYVPLFSVGSSKLCRKTHVDLMNKVQINMYAAGLHKDGSSAVNRYTSMELKDKFALMNLAFGQKEYKVNKKLIIVK